MKLLVMLASLVLFSSCYMEWDIPKTPRRDPCTQEVENKYVYVQPACPNPAPRNPHDFNDEAHGPGH